MIQLFGRIADFFFPRHCIACQSVIPESQHPFCPSCYQKQIFASQADIDQFYSQKFQQSALVSQIFPLYSFTTDSVAQALIHGFKYKKQFHLAKYAGRLIGQLIINSAINLPDLIIPVPLHYRKRIERGYNQSDYLAQGIHSVTHIPVCRGAVRRIKNTKTQTRLTLAERQENMNQAFRIQKQDIILGRTILLVDDVMTTGSTISECAAMLKSAGAISVSAASAAIVLLE